MLKKAIAMVAPAGTTAIMNAQLAVGLLRTARQAYRSNLTVRDWVQVQQDDLLDGGLLAKFAPKFGAAVGEQFASRLMVSDLAYDLEFGDVDKCASTQKPNGVPGDGEGYTNELR